VLVAKGFTRVAFAEFDVAFQDFLRGIHGPEADRNLLIFLAAYLRSRLARFFLFHTSSHWGITRQQVHVDELLRLPFFVPDQSKDPSRSLKIVDEIVNLVTDATKRAGSDLVDRQQIVREASEAIEPLVEEYFDIIPHEKVLLDDTARFTIPSVLPTRRRSSIPTIEPSSDAQRELYTRMLCETLNGWSKSGRFAVEGRVAGSGKLGIAVAALHKRRSTDVGPSMPDIADLLPALDRIRKAASQKLNTLELLRGAKVFDRDHLYVVKPIAQRFWTQTAALNDADEIAGTILMEAPQRAAW
jgi:hypothetical protein